MRVCICLCACACVRERETGKGYQIERYKLCRGNTTNFRTHEYYWVFFLNRKLFVKSPYLHSLVSLTFLLLNVNMERDYQCAGDYRFLETLEGPNDVLRATDF